MVQLFIHTPELTGIAKELLGMSQFRLDQLQPGMIIAEDTQSSQGRLVFPRGTRLSTNDIKTLKAWGIPEVSILDHEMSSGVDDLTKFDQDQIAQAEKMIDSLFCKSNSDHPVIQELKRIALGNKLKFEKEG